MKLYEITESLATLQEMAEEEEVCDGVPTPWKAWRVSLKTSWKHMAR